MTDETVLSSFDPTGKTISTLVGQNIKLVASGLISDGDTGIDGLKLTLTSSNTSVAVLDASSVTADNDADFTVNVATIGTGTATITGTPTNVRNPNNLKWTATINVVAGQISGIVLTPSSGTISVGGSVPGHVGVKTTEGQEINYLDGSSVTLMITCDNAAIGKVDVTTNNFTTCGSAFASPADFVFKGLAPGTATFHVSAPTTQPALANLTATATLNVAPAGAKVVFADASKNPTLFTTQSTTLSATVQDVNNTVITTIPITYSLKNSSDANFVTLDQTTGALTVKTTLDQPSRVVEVVASAIQNNQTLATSSALVTIKSRLQNVALSPSGTLPVNAGQNTQLSVVPTFEPGAPTSPAPVISYESSDASKVSVDANGLLHALASTGAAPVTITAKSEGRTSNTLSVTVTGVPDPVITFTPAGPVATLGVAAGIQLKAEVTSNPIAGGTLSLAIGNPLLATFSPSVTTPTLVAGSLTGKGTGTTTVDATYTNGTQTFTKSIQIVVGGSPSTSRVAYVLVEPINAAVTVPVGFSYRPRFFDKDLVELSTAEVIADGGTVSFFNTNDAVGTVVKSITTPTQAQFTPAGPGTEEVTVLYSKGTQNIALGSTNVTVNAAAAGNLGSLQLVMTGPGTTTANATRQLHVNETALVQIAVRDQANQFVTSGLTSLTLEASPTSAVTIVPTAPPAGQQGFYYLVTAKQAGSVILTAKGPGVQNSIQFSIVP